MGKNLISGIGNFFSEIAIVSLIEGGMHNSTISNSTLSNSTNLVNRTSIDFGFHSTSFLTRLLVTSNDAIYKITQEYDVPSAAESEASGSAVSGIFISLLLPAGKKFHTILNVNLLIIFLTIINCSTSHFNANYWNCG